MAKKYVKHTRDPRIGPLSRETKNRESSVTAQEIERAIYIDFEGFENKPPTLIGVLCVGDFTQIVFDPDMRLAADVKILPAKPAKQTIEDLLKRAIDENRRIVGYTQHEKNVARIYLETDLSVVYADARMVAAKWLKRIKQSHAPWRREHPNWDIERTLKNFMKLIGYPRPPHLGIEKSTSRIRHVRDMLARRGNYEKLTKTAKAKWTKLLDHNRHDVFGMRDLMVKAVRDYVPR